MLPAGRVQPIKRDSCFSSARVHKETASYFLMISNRLVVSIPCIMVDAHELFGDRVTQ